MSDIERIARLKMSLQEIEPVIWRQVEMPVTSSLKAVHDVIQAAFGWEDYHLFEFEVGGRRYGCTSDFGDDWRHEIVIQAIEDGAPDTAYPRLVTGERQRPARSHENHADMLAWYGDPFDPEDIDRTRSACATSAASLVSRCTSSRMTRVVTSFRYCVSALFSSWNSGNSTWSTKPFGARSITVVRRCR